MHSNSIEILSELLGFPFSEQRTPALVLKNLWKSFGRPAVSGLDLTVMRGEVYALLGPNGAGKTTTLRMIAGLLPPDDGSIRIYDVDALADPLAAKRLTAWLPDDPLVYDRLTALEYLEYVAGLWGVPPQVAETRGRELLEWLGLWEHRDERCGGFSRGMKQKTALAGALIHDPKLLMLDEPLTGLDASIARQVKDMLRQRTAEGVGVIVTSHILDVVERLADRIGIIKSGRLIAEGTLAELRAFAGAEGGTLEDVFLQLVGEEEQAA
jgi:ABC-2 type transport system ATP-binding protein